MVFLMVVSLFYRTKIINKVCNLVAFGIFFKKYWFCDNQRDLREQKATQIQNMFLCTYSQLIDRRTQEHIL